MSSSLNVLIVEDDAVARILIQSTVIEAGHTVVSCETAEEAVQHYQAGFFPLVILDLNLPGMDGLQFSQWVRSQPWGDRVFILVSTGCNQPEDLQKVLVAGADDYIAKPHERGLLRVRLAVAKRHLEDIEKRKQAEATLVASEQRFSLFMNNLPGVAFMKDLDGRYIYINETIRQLYEEQHPEFLGKTDEDLWPADVAKTLRANDQRAIQSKAAIQAFEDLPLRETVRHWFVHKFPILGDNGTVELIAGLGIDTTELRLFEELNRSILENATDGFLIIDPEGRIIEANRAYQRMTGFSREDLLRLRLHDLTTCSAELTDEKMRTVAAAGGEIFEATHRCKEGGTIEFEVSATCLDLGGRPRFVAFFRDITERRKLAEERLKVNRLEAIGLLAGGIAHEFNNAMTAVIGNISLAQNDVPTESPASLLLLRALQGCRRTASLTKRLLTFAKGGEPIKRKMPLPKYLQEVVLSCLKETKSRAGLQINADLWPVEIDPEQLAQAIRNIIRNAQEAMPAGGGIRVRAENTTTQENQISGLAAGRFVKISISDEGPGIPQDINNRIFDPYFTTKSGAAGLGLSICYSIVKRHNGVIHTDSPSGKGATFSIYLPAYSDSQRAPKSSLPANGAIRNVLVMDDDPDVCDLLQAMMERKGFKVAITKDGAEAIRAFIQARESGSPFHVVFMDLTVPGGLGGMETQRELLKIDPSVKSIVCSGYSSDPVMANYLECGFVGRLPKPFTNEDLLRAIAELQPAV
jgi:PAS domain S-box-containing protein